jgi:hypothetical protein
VPASLIAESSDERNVSASFEETNAVAINKIESEVRLKLTAAVQQELNDESKVTKKSEHYYLIFPSIHFVEGHMTASDHTVDGWPNLILITFEDAQGASDKRATRARTPGAGTA